MSLKEGVQQATFWVARMDNPPPSTTSTAPSWHRSLDSGGNSTVTWRLLLQVATTTIFQSQPTWICLFGAKIFLLNGKVLGKRNTYSPKWWWKMVMKVMNTMVKSVKNITNKNNSKASACFFESPSSSWSAWKSDIYNSSPASRIVWPPPESVSLTKPSRCDTVKILGGPRKFWSMVRKWI